MPKAAAKAAGAADAPKEAQAAVREKKAAVSGNEADYTVRELVEASESALHVPKECAAAAFKFQKAERFTLTEARNIVEKFMKKEVK